MSKQSTPLLTLALVASAAISAHRFVTVAGALSGVDGNALGVSRTAAQNGESFPVDVIGTTIVEAGAPITAGQTLESDGTGRGIPWASAGARVAIALQAASAAGQFIEVLLLPNAA